jgi:protein-S-isoprenylcysteine O-methyltransferase Ste14
MADIEKLKKSIKSHPLFPFVKMLLDLIEQAGNGLFFAFERLQSAFELIQRILSRSEKPLRESELRLKKFKSEYDRKSLNVLMEVEKRVSTKHRYLVFPPLGMAFLFATHFLTIYPLCLVLGVNDRGNERPAVKRFGQALTLLAIIAYNLTGHYQQRKSGGNPFPLLETTGLVTTGPYASSRNPMLLVKLLAIAGIGFVLNSARFIFVVLPLYAAASVAYVKGTEEPFLKKKFGPQYEEYTKRVPFIIPGLK